MYLKEMWDREGAWLPGCLLISESTNHLCNCQIILINISICSSAVFTGKKRTVLFAYFCRYNKNISYILLTQNTKVGKPGISVPHHRCVVLRVVHNPNNKCPVEALWWSFSIDGTYQFMCYCITMCTYKGDVPHMFKNNTD